MLRGENAPGYEDWTYRVPAGPDVKQDTELLKLDQGQSLYLSIRMRPIKNKQLERLSPSDIPTVGKRHDDGGDFSGRISLEGDRSAHRLGYEFINRRLGH